MLQKKAGMPLKMQLMVHTCLNATKESRDAIEDAIDGAYMVFVTLFAANQNQPPEIENVLVTNRSKFPRFFGDFHFDQGFVLEIRTMSEANLNNALRVGSCCLVGVIWDERLYVANLGDSRAVKGYLSKSNKIAAEQLTSDHNASRKEVRRELKAMHPGDKNIVYKRENMWRIKGIIQVSRAIGDAYLKKPEFSIDARFARFHLPEAIHRPVLKADPSVLRTTLVM